MCAEIPLAGGRITQGVVRKGDYVLRPCCANSNFVHEVLKWLEKKDISASPRFIGLTDDGREMTSFLEGESPNNLGYFNDNQLFEAGIIIKKLHIALSDFRGCSNNLTVCHNDLSPCNFMFKNGLPYAVFDWDAAEINDPLNDVAYASWMWCEIGNDENTPAEVGRKIKVILDAYQLCKDRRKLLIAKIHEQIQRVSKSLYADNYYEPSQWAYSCGLWLEKHKNQIVTYFA
jgi:thiamine kinase-like enzyme